MRALPNCKNASLTLIQGRNRCFKAKINFFALLILFFALRIDFRFKTSIPSLNQGHGSILTVRECAKSIPRLEKPKNRRFSHKNPKSNSQVKKYGYNERKSKTEKRDQKSAIVTTFPIFEPFSLSDFLIFIVTTFLIFRKTLPFFGFRFPPIVTVA